ncbi:MAG: tetratricopeptide repeat protein [Ardenticatenales bacterium]|nr:tetratricopeptide repeat protein [Ardenticatenales bacterium]
MWTDLLAAYLPIDRRGALAQGNFLPNRAVGAALFADLSGFTPLTEAMTRELGPRRGAEEVARQMNQIYEALLAPVHGYGGSVIGFAGDALICYFDQDGGLRATACALAMQEEMRAFRAVPLPTGRNVTLALKVGIAAGPVRRFLVGDPEIQRLEVLAGQTVGRMAAAEQLGQQGEIILHGATARMLDDHLQIAEWREGDFALITGLRIEVPRSPWPEQSLEHLPQDALRPWVPLAVYERLQSGQGELLLTHPMGVTELRPAVALFMHFKGIDYDGDEAAGEKLDAFVRWVQQVVTEYEGTLLDLTLGDKGSYLYLVFGVPVAHENDALRAARVAQLLQTPPDSLAYIGQRQIGISRGIMRAGIVGGRQRRSYTVLGHEVNVAARLMEAAAPGQVLVSGRIQTAIGALCHWRALPPLQVKGKEEAVALFALEEAPAYPSLQLQEGRYALPMIGRQATLQQMSEHLSRTLQGVSQMVGITGEAGIGKSRLLGATIDLAQGRGMVAFGGACQSYGTNMPYLVWHSIWRAFFGLEESATLDEQVATLTERLRRLNPSFVPRLPLLGEVLGLPIPDNTLTASLDPALRKTSREALLVDTLKLHLRRTPTLLVLEDVHWIDPLSHDLLEAVGRAIWQEPLLIMLTYRPPDLARLQESRVSALPHFTEIALTELTQQEAEWLVSARLKERNSMEHSVETLLAQVLARSGGNPFYIEELLVYLLESAVDLTDPGAVAALEWPSSLESLILSRLDRLGEAEQLTLKVASIIGRSFRAAWLWGYYPALGSPDQVTSTLAELEQMDLTVQDTPGPDAVYLFKHVLTQEVTYGSLAYALRAPLHEQLGRYLETTADRAGHLDLLAYHYERSENLAKKREYLRKAGEAAQAATAIATALDYYERLLPHLQEAGEQVDIYLNLGTVLEGMGRWEEAEVWYEEALRLGETVDGARRARSIQALGTLYGKQGVYREALRWLEQARADWEALNDTRGVSQTLAELGIVAWRQGDYRVARGYLEQSLHLCQAELNDYGQAYALNYLGNVLSDEGEMKSAQALYEKSLALRRALGDKVGIGISLNNLGVVAYSQRDYERARVLYEESLVLRREVGQRWGVSLALLNLGLVAYQQGNHDAARSLYEEALVLAREIGDRRSMVYVLLGLAAITIERATTEEELHRLTQLIAATDAVRATLGAIWEPVFQEFRDETLLAARARLSNDAFNAAWSRGQTLTLEETALSVTFRPRKG